MSETTSHASKTNNNKSENKLKIQTARDKLKAYYGLQNTNTNTNDNTSIVNNGNNNLINSVETSSVSGGGGSKLDNLIKQGIDDTEFNPTPYLNQILKNCPLKTLLHLNNQWVNDIKQLEGDKNNLIYNNYSKFLFATQAIGELRTSLDAILPNLKGLETSINTVGENLINLGQTLEPTRNTLSETYTTNKLLKQSEFLLNLPKNLNYLLKTKNYSNLIFQLKLTEGALEKYKNLNLFGSISKDCEGIKERVKLELVEELELSKDNIEKTSILINLISSLTPSSIPHWFNYYLNFSKNYLQSKLQTQNLTTNESNLEEQLIQLDTLILPELSNLIDNFEVLFNEKFRKDYLKIEVNNDDKSKFLSKFKQFGLSQYDLYYSKIFSALINSNNLTQILKLFNLHLTNLNNITLLKSDKLVGIKQKLTDIIFNWYDNYLQELIMGVGNELKVKYTDIFQLESINLTYTLQNITTLDNFSLQSALILGENQLLELLIKSLLPNLQNLVVTNFKFWELTGLGGKVLDLLLFKFKEFWLGFVDRVLEDLILESNPKNLNLILILTKLTNDCYLNLIETIYLTFIQSLIQDNPLLPLIKINEETLMKLWISECRELSQVYQKKSSNLLTRFCINYGQYLVGELANYYDGGEDDKAMIDQFDPIFLNILVKIHLLEREICIVFGIGQDSRDNFDGSNSNNIGGGGFSDSNFFENKRLSINRSSFQSNLGAGAGGITSPSYRNSLVLPNSPNLSSNPNTNSDQHHHLLTKINRLFYERIEYYPNQTNFNLKEILNNIINILLKGYCEYIRVGYWSMLNLTKINLNLINWKLNLPAVIINSNNFNNLIEEINTSLIKRCISKNFSDTNYHNLDNLLNTIYLRDSNWLYINQKFEFIPINNNQGGNQFVGIKEED